jgi:hypothetical protein
VKEENLAFRQQLGFDKGIIEDLTAARDEALKKARGFEKLREALAEILPTAVPSAGQLPTGLPNGQVGLQHNVIVVDVPAIEKLVTVSTENMRGKILAVARKGKLDAWRKLDEIVKAVQEERWNASPQEVNNALNDLEKQDLIAKKHTDRNYYCLAQGVSFAKEAS